jgi:UDP-N-acetylglucosamine:LPS N-acetylglucosamine transferase
MIKDKRKYLIFYLKTGGGHFAPASSLANYLNRHHSGEVTPVLVDGFEKINRLVKYLVEEGYRKLQTKAKWAYEALYALNKLSLFGRASCFIVTRSSVKFIEEIIQKENPEKIVLLHFFLVDPVYKALDNLKLKLPVYTVITDPYTAHPIWAFRKGQEYIVFSERLKRAFSNRVPADKIHVFPFILEEKYSQPIPISAIPKLKTEMGFTVEKKLILIMGGGDGIPHGRMILENLLNAEPDAEIAVVCGKNKSFYNKALRLKEKHPEIKMKVYEFVNFVYELLNISDVVITKCGASTMMEILILNKVPVVNDYIWEQEKGNIEFVRDNELGIYERDISRVPSAVIKLIEDNSYYEKFRNNIKEVGIKNGISDVAEFLIKNIKNLVPEK